MDLVSSAINSLNGYWWLGIGIFVAVLVCGLFAFDHFRRKRLQKEFGGRTLPPSANPNSFSATIRRIKSFLHSLDEQDRKRVQSSERNRKK
jgi:hypothetical protein